MKQRYLFLLLICLLFYAHSVCADKVTESHPKKEGAEKMAFELTSPAFKDGQDIPSKYTGEGEDVSPPLKWCDPPEETKGFALICDDPDAPGRTWVHWVVYNIPANVRELSEAVPPDKILPDGTRQGVTDFGRIGYNGPYPPPGDAHRYFFKLYALDTMLELVSGATKQQLLEEMQDHILAETQLMGRYKR